MSVWLSRAGRQASEPSLDNEGGTERDRRGREGKRRGGPGFPRKGVSFLFPRTSRDAERQLATWRDGTQNKRGTCQVTISAGTRTRNLWIRSPARSSIAPQRPHHTHSISTRTEKAHTFCITSHLGILLAPEQWGGRDSWKIWSGDPPAGSVALSPVLGVRVPGDRGNGAPVIAAPEAPRVPGALAPSSASRRTLAGYSHVNDAAPARCASTPLPFCGFTPGPPKLSRGAGPAKLGIPESPGSRHKGAAPRKQRGAEGLRHRARPGSSAQLGDPGRGLSSGGGICQAWASGTRGLCAVASVSSLELHGWGGDGRVVSVRARARAGRKGASREEGTGGQAAPH